VLDPSLAAQAFNNVGTNLLFDFQRLSQKLLGAPVHREASIPVAGSLSVAGTADLAGNTATFNANNVCTAVIAAGEQSVGFHLTAGTLDATLTPYITNQIGAVNCATAGTCTATAFSSGASIVVTNPSGVKDVGVNLVGGVRQVQVCTTTYSSGSASGVVTATFVQAAWLGHTIDTGGALRSVGFVLNPGSYNGQVTPSTSKDNSNWATVGFIRPDTSLTNTFSGNLSAGLFLGVQMVSGDRYARVCTSNFTSGTATAFLTATNIAQQQTLSTQLPLSLDGSGFLAVHEQGTATVSGTVTANIGTSGSLALDATLTGGTQKAIVRGGAKGATAAADVTSTANGVDHQGLDVNVNNTPTVTANAGSGTFNIQANASTNLAQINGTTILTGNGTTGAGSPRVTIASDNTPFTVNAAQSGSWTADLSDRAARLLGVVYGSQAQQLKQTATNFNLQVELASAARSIDPRSIRALTPRARGLRTSVHSPPAPPRSTRSAGSSTTRRPPRLTTGKAAAARITNEPRALHINLRNAGRDGDWDLRRAGAARTRRAATTQPDLRHRHREHRHLRLARARRQRHRAPGVAGLGHLRPEGRARSRAR
jgi:hypothetical protein